MPQQEKAYETIGCLFFVLWFILGIVAFIVTVPRGSFLEGQSLYLWLWFILGIVGVLVFGVFDMMDRILTESKYVETSYRVPRDQYQDEEGKGSCCSSGCIIVLLLLIPLALFLLAVALGKLFQFFSTAGYNMTWMIPSIIS